MNAITTRELVRLFLGFRGLPSRQPYFLAGLLLLVIQFFLLFRFMAVPEGTPESGFWAFAFMVAAVLSVFSNIALTVKRLQDINRPRLLAVLYLHRRLRHVGVPVLRPRHARSQQIRFRHQPARVRGTMATVGEKSVLYRTIDAERVIATAALLEARISDRFPESGLRKVSIELIALGRDIAREAKALEAPIRWLRILTLVTILIGIAIIAFVMTILSFDRISTGAFDFVQGIEATLNTMLLVGLGMITLTQMELRVKRRKVFDGLHALRSMIHVIDMHQLTKDPAALSEDFKPAPHSPQRKLSAADLSRYLDYCSEMLSITGKLAALYAQSVNDEVVVQAVNDVESLGTNLSRKIWQKIIMIAEKTSSGRKIG